MQAIRQVKLAKSFARYAGTGSPQGAPYQVYVGGVAWAATNEDIRRHFSDCGNVTSVSFSWFHFYVILSELFLLFLCITWLCLSYRSKFQLIVNQDVPEDSPLLLLILLKPLMPP